MFKAGQVWSLDGVSEFRVISIKSDWVMSVEYIKSGVCQDVNIDDFVDIINNYDYTVKEAE